MPGEFKVKVVGLSFVDGYPENVYLLNDIAGSEDQQQASAMEPLPAVLIRNPANAFDANAIEVHIPALGDHAMVGHVPAAVAKRLSPCLDQGEVWKSDIYMVAVHPEHPENPGIHLMIQKISDSAEPF